MKSDTRALGAVFLGGLAIAMIITAIGCAAAANWIPRQAAVGAMFATFLIGSALLAARLGPTLMAHKDRKPK